MSYCLCSVDQDRDAVRMGQGNDFLYRIDKSEDIGYLGYADEFSAP